MPITVQIASRIAGIPPAARLRQWVRAALPRGAGESATPAKVSITLRVVNRAEARRLNRGFRDQDHATNVLTFAYSSAPVAADIVLCAPVITSEARDQGKTARAHYAHLTVHGVLHACGFDHATRRQATLMEARETAILSKLGFANPYQTQNHG